VWEFSVCREVVEEGDHRYPKDINFFVRLW